MPQQPNWKIPPNLLQLLEEDEDDIWEDDQWAPVLLTAMAGTSYEGRDIPIMWQIEFEPPDGRDGDEWAELVAEAFSKRHPDHASELHSDSESDTCVLWVESEHTCKHLIETAWPLVCAAEA
ncbi:MAG: hypothetical protein AAF711_00805 [Planctomycetota bacterium]